MTIHKELSIPYLKTIGIVNNGFNGRGFQNPHSLTIGPDQKIFVLNRCDVARRKAIRIGVMNYDEDYLYEFGYGFGSEDAQLALAVDMVFDSAQRIHVTDEFNNRVNVYSETGEYLTKWGESGSGEGQFDGPSGITTNSHDEMIVVDQRNNRVQKYSLDGRFISQLGQLGSGEGQFNLPWGVCVDGADNVYVADWRNDRVQKFDNSGNY
ncbi:MAG: 6-bladed beta-propeller, partial [SAR202 cluster bacterium]